MAKDKRSGIDYYEYKRRQEALRKRANPEAVAGAEAPAPAAKAEPLEAPEAKRKGGLMGNVKKLVGGFGGRMDEDPEDFEPEAETAGPEAITPMESAPQTAAEIAPEPVSQIIPEPVSQIVLEPIADRPQAAPQPEADETDLGIDIQDVARHIAKPQSERSLPKLLDDEPLEDEEETPGPFAEVFGKAKLLGGALKRRLAQRSEAKEKAAAPKDAEKPKKAEPESDENEGENPEGAPLSVALGEAFDAPADVPEEKSRRSRRKEAESDDEAETPKARFKLPAVKRKPPEPEPDDEADSEADEEADEEDTRPARRGFFSFLGAPSAHSANEEDDEDEEDVPRRKGFGLFARRKEDAYDEENDEEYDDEYGEEYDDENGEDDEMNGEQPESGDLTRQLAADLEGGQPALSRRERRALAEASAERAEESAKALPPEPVAPEEKPVARREKRKLEPEISDDYDREDEDDEPARPISRRRAAPIAEDEDDEPARPVSRRRAAPIAEDEDDEPARPVSRRRAAPIAEEYVDEPTQKFQPIRRVREEPATEEAPAARRGKAARYERPAPVSDDEYDDYEDEDDEDDVLPVRRYGQRKKAKRTRVYQDEDIDESAYDDENYDSAAYEEDDDYDEYDEEYDDERMSFGKRFLRFLKGFVLLLLILVLGVLALRQLESSGKISLNGLRSTVGALIPLDGIFPAPAPKEAIAPQAAEPAETVLPTAEPAAPATAAAPSEAAPLAPTAAATEAPDRGVELPEASPEADTPTAEFLENPGAADAGDLEALS